jgi:hypothetical protein
LFPRKEIDRARIFLTIAAKEIGTGADMKFHTTGRIVALALAVAGGPALAEGPRVYAYEGGPNYCPAGLQPITLNGVICCGAPNQAQSYQQAQRHPVTRIRSARVRYDACLPGQKGCN